MTPEEEAYRFVERVSELRREHKSLDVALGAISVVLTAAWAARHPIRTVRLLSLLHAAKLASR